MPGVRGGFTPGFRGGSFDSPFSRGRRDRFEDRFENRFGRRDRFEDLFESRFGSGRFDRFEDRFENRFRFGPVNGAFLPHFTGGFVPTFPGGLLFGF
jgi:hypothetical protein